MRADSLLFHDDFRVAPYWWDAAPPETSRVALPANVDVVIVGSGYCGLSAAAEAALHGATVAVLDTAELGAGGSTRSGGGPARRPDSHRRCCSTGTERRDLCEIAGNVAGPLEPLVRRLGVDPLCRRA